MKQAKIDRELGIKINRVACAIQNAVETTGLDPMLIPVAVALAATRIIPENEDRGRFGAATGAVAVELMQEGGFTKGTALAFLIDSWDLLISLAIKRRPRKKA